MQEKAIEGEVEEPESQDPECWSVQEWSLWVMHEWDPQDGSREGGGWVTGW